MPRFTKQGGESNPPIHYKDWEPGEQIVLRARRTWAISATAEQAGLGINIGELQGLSREEMTQRLTESVDPVAAQAALLVGMIESWTFAYEDGSVVPVTDETVRDFTPEEFAFLNAEIAKRSSAVEVPEAKDADFRSPTDPAGEGAVPGVGDATSETNPTGG